MKNNLIKIEKMFNVYKYEQEKRKRVEEREQTE